MNNEALNTVSWESRPQPMYQVWRVWYKPQTFWEWVFDRRTKKEWPQYLCDTQETAKTLANNLNRDEAPLEMYETKYEVREKTIWRLRDDYTEVDGILKDLISAEKD